MGRGIKGRGVWGGVVGGVYNRGAVCSHRCAILSYKFLCCLKVEFLYGFTRESVVCQDILDGSVN